MAQQLTVIGDPLECRQQHCTEPASIMLRQVSKGTIEVILYCDRCWLRLTDADVPSQQTQTTIEATSEDASVQKAEVS